MASLPTELWLEILNKVQSNADLNAILSSSKYFHQLTYPLLYDHVEWPANDALVHTIAFVYKHPSLLSVIREARLAGGHSHIVAGSPISAANPPPWHNQVGAHALTAAQPLPPPFVDDDFDEFQNLPFNFPILLNAPPAPPHPNLAVVAQQWIDEHQDEIEEATHPEPVPLDQEEDSPVPSPSKERKPLDPPDPNSAPLIQALRILPLLNQLEKLELHDLDLPNLFFDIVKSLTKLDELSVVRAKVLSFAENVGRPDFTMLPYKTLTLSGIDWTDATGQRSVCALAHASGIKTLRLDGIARRVLSTLLADNIHLPLETLATDTQNPFITRFDEHDFMVLRQFLTVCPTIKSLSLTRMPKTGTVPPSLLPNLQSFEGPPHAVLEFVRGRAVRDLTVLEKGKFTETPTTATATHPDNQGLTMSDIIHLVERLHSFGVPLRSLAFVANTWEYEMLYMLMQLYPSLESLKVAFVRDGPDDQFMMAFGPRYGDKFPELKRLHLYTLNDKTANEVREEDWREQGVHLGRWERYCSKLNEVALAPDVMWTKFAPHDWKRKVLDVTKFMDVPIRFIRESASRIR